MQHDAYSENESRIADAAFSTVAGAPGVRKLRGEPLATREALVQMFLPRTADGSRISGIQVRGVSENVFGIRPEVRIVRGRAALAGADEAIIGSAIAGKYVGLSLDGTFALRSGRQVRIVGVFDSGGTAYDFEVWTGFDVVRTSLGWEGYLSSMTVVLDAPQAFEGFALSIEVDKSAALVALRERSYYERISEGLAHSVQALGQLVTLIFACGAVLGATITMNEAIARRRKEIGVLRALGFSALEVMLAFLVESVTVAVVGASIGVAVASGLSAWEFTITNYSTGNELAFPFKPAMAIVMNSMLLGALCGVLGGLLPALRAACTNPAVAMRV